MAALRRYLFALGIANLVLAGLAEVASSAATGFCYSTITSNYRHLDTRGVVDHDRAAEIVGPEAKEDWVVVVDYLIDEPLRGLYSVSHAVAVVLGLNGMLLLAMWWRFRKVT